MHPAPVYFGGFMGVLQRVTSRVLPGVVAVALFAQYRGGPTLSFARPASLLLVLTALGGVLSALPGPTWRRRALACGAGIAAGGLFVWGPPAVGWSIASLVLLVQVLRRCRGVMFFAAPALVGVAAAHTSALAGFQQITLFGWMFTALKALLIALLLEGRKEPRVVGTRALGSALLVLTIGLVVLRVMDVVGVLSGPVEVSWAEAPFLVDMLKLDAHQPIYGPLDQLNSYSYSPLLQILHHGLLSPFHAELSLVANRALGLVDVFVASVIFAWAAAPHVAAGLARLLPSRSHLWGFAIALLVGFSSLLAGSIHPDHPSLACLAVAFALALRESSWPRWLWWSALLLVTPAATAFKLTGAGIGVGLVAVMIVERRLRACLVLAASAVLSAATIPLFDATCGPFSTYAIAMQRSHPIEWPRLFWPPTIHFAAATALALAVGIGMLGRGVPDDTRTTLRRSVLLFGGVVALMLPAYLKFAGRENNLLALLILCVLVVLVAAAGDALAEGARFHPLLGPVVALYVIMLVWTPHAPSPVPPVPMLAQMREVDAVMTDDDRVGERTLVPSAALWILHGRHDVPVDRTNTAYELFFGHHPEAELFFQHIEDGRYRSIVVWSGDLSAPPGHEATHAFAERYVSALDARYDRIYPPPDVPLAAVVYVIYRRR
jgi:hypothetical protein